MLYSNSSFATDCLSGELLDRAPKKKQWGLGGVCGWLKIAAVVACACLCFSEAKIKLQARSGQGSAGPEHRFFTLKTKKMRFLLLRLCADINTDALRRASGSYVLCKLLDSDLDLDMDPCFNQETTAESVYW